MCAKLLKISISARKARALVGCGVRLCADLQGGHCCGRCRREKKFPARREKYVRRISKYVGHILKYLRHNFYLLPEGCNGVKMSFRFPWLKNGVPRPGFCGCECPPCRVAAGLPEKVRIKNACPANVAGTHYNISPALGRVSLSCWRISLWRAPRWLPQSCP